MPPPQQIPLLPALAVWEQAHPTATRAADTILASVAATTHNTATSTTTPTMLPSQPQDGMSFAEKRDNAIGALLALYVFCLFAVVVFAAVSGSFRVPRALKWPRCCHSGEAEEGRRARKTQDCPMAQRSRESQGTFEPFTSAEVEEKEEFRCRIQQGARAQESGDRDAWHVYRAMLDSQAKGNKLGMWEAGIAHRMTNDLLGHATGQELQRMWAWLDVFERRRDGGM